MVTTIGGILYGTLLLLQGCRKLLYGNDEEVVTTMTEIDGMVKGIYPIRGTRIDLELKGITDETVNYWEVVESTQCI